MSKADEPRLPLPAAVAELGVGVSLGHRVFRFQAKFTVMALNWRFGAQRGLRSIGFRAVSRYRVTSVKQVSPDQGSKAGNREPLNNPLLSLLQ